MDQDGLSGSLIKLEWRSWLSMDSTESVAIIFFLPLCLLFSPPLFFRKGGQLVFARMSLTNHVRSCYACLVTEI